MDADHFDTAGLVTDASACGNAANAGQVICTICGDPMSHADLVAAQKDHLMKVCEQEGEMIQSQIMKA